MCGRADNAELCRAIGIIRPRLLESCEKKEQVGVWGMIGERCLLLGPIRDMMQLPDAIGRSETRQELKLPGRDIIGRQCRILRLCNITVSPGRGSASLAL